MSAKKVGTPKRKGAKAGPTPVSWKAPTEYMKPQPPFICMLDEMYIINYTNALKAAGVPQMYEKVKANTCCPGDKVYVIADVAVEGDEAAGEAAVAVSARNVYFGAVLHQGVDVTRVHYTNWHLVNGDDPEDHEYFEDIPCTDMVYRVQNTNVGRVGGQSGSVYELIASNPLFTRNQANGPTPTQQEARIAMLARSVSFMQSQITVPNHAEIVEKANGDSAWDDTHTMHLLAKDAVEKEVQVLVDAAGGTAVASDTFAQQNRLGKAAKNIEVVLWAVGKLPAPRPQLGSSTANSDAHVSVHRVDTSAILQAIQKLQEEVTALRGADTVAQIKVAASMLPTVGAVADPPGDGACAFHVGNWLIQLTDDPNPDNLEVSKKKLQQVKETIIANACARKDELVATFQSQNRSSDQQETAGGKTLDQVVTEGIMNDLGEPLESYIARVLEGKGTDGWGGFETFSLVSKETEVRCVIIDGRKVTSGASDEVIVKATYRAGCRGEKDKTKTVFVVWTGNHYKLGMTITGGQKQAIFNVGEESDAALKNIISFLKSQSSPAKCSEMKGSDRSKEIKKLVEGKGKISTVKLGETKPHVTFADVVQTGADDPKPEWQEPGTRKTRKRRERRQKQEARSLSPIAEYHSHRSRSQSPVKAQRSERDYSPGTAVKGKRGKAPRKIPTVVVTTGASPGDFLQDLARRNKGLRALVDGVTEAKSDFQLILTAYPENVEALRNNLEQFRKQGLRVRAFDHKNGLAPQSAQKKLLCEFEFQGKKCPRGSQCHKHHREK